MGAKASGTKTGTITVRLDDRNKADLEFLAEELNESTTNIVREALAFLAKHKRREQMRMEAQAVANDPRERQLAADIEKDFEGTNAW
ncbi:putative transcriptional regulator [Rhodococcus sp. LBL1]|nr:putative transcriptional regulator [Rhodococcus sp. LBL1]MDH6684029.1 putative transcriptional regulator [Rhodococcus sp. LBL2]